MKTKKISPTLKQLLAQLDHVNHEIAENKEAWLRNTRSYKAYAKIRVELEGQRLALDKKIEAERRVTI